MRAMLPTLLIIAATVHSSPLLAAENQFQEYCNQTKASVSNPQARWSCSNRGYKSLAQLYSDLDEKNPRSKWESPTWLQNDPVLTNLQGKEIFWDCVPNKEVCGIWVKITPTQLVFIQQLLDRQRNNNWLGVGLTVFCEGTVSTCHKTQELVAKLLPRGNLGETSVVGGPPPAPPRP